ncbi:hypothetical protein LP420_06765 [Massilia sp. B-10]|nr:hypothetical protein LP420_06765 [Massilia sp. B-10]
MLENLAAEHAAGAALDQAAAALGRQYDVPDARAFLDALAQLAQQLRTGHGPRALIATLRAHPDAQAAARAAASTGQPLAALRALLEPELTIASDAGLDRIAELLRDLREALDDLPDLLPMLRALHAGDPATARMLQQLDYTPEQLDALVADEALRRAERDSPVLAHFGGAALAQAARGQPGSARAAGARCASDPRHAASAIRRTRACFGPVRQPARRGLSKTFKKAYATGRRELEHEFGKSMRHRSIRDLSDDETGLVIADLKPVWLMSPLSVSDTLPLASNLFDVVIFDEASQIPVEEAVPALSRAPDHRGRGRNATAADQFLPARAHPAATMKSWSRKMASASPSTSIPTACWRRPRAACLGHAAGMALPQPPRVPHQLLERGVLRWPPGDHSRHPARSACGRPHRRAVRTWRTPA